MSDTINPHRAAEVTRDELNARRAAQRPAKDASDPDVMIAAAELGVTPQLLAAVLERRSLHLKPTPKRATQVRRYVPKREVIRYATEALRRHIKVVGDESIRTGLSELIQHLELET